MENVYLNDFEDDTVIINPDQVQQEEEPNNEDQTVVQDPLEEEPHIDQEDIITELLKSYGITDKSKILYENENGEEVEVSWNSLSKEDKLGILQTPNHSISNELDDSEVQLINTIRNSKMSPSEYIQYIEKQGVDRYVQNSQVPHYSIDDYSDDDLFMMDLIARLGDNITDNEVRDALEQAKSNEVLYNKQIEALRNEYRKSEQDRLNQEEYEKQQIAQEQYNQFSNSIYDQINGFKEFYGCDIDLDQNDKQELFEFITGFDEAGNNHFAKALNDPNLVVKMAWTLLNGDKLIEDINDYYKSKITEVSKNSYNKGLKDANKNNSNFIIKENNNQDNNNYFDYDEF